MNRHESIGLVASFVDRSKWVPVLRHTLPKLKPLPIYADRVDDTASYIRTEMTTRHFSLDRFHAYIGYAFKFTLLCI